ncbi:MAG: Type II secretion system protein G [Microgenomates bacterium 39_7]|nr:MAG: Type II secretion system protein G [Microgenomates bacterium 39_7]
MKDFEQLRKGGNITLFSNHSLKSDNSRKKSILSKGFSLIEVLVVVAILAILMIIFLFFMQRHLMRSRDVQRKADLDKIRFAFEEYYNDYRCYPSPGVMLECGSSVFQPYLKEIPCDPLSKKPYVVQFIGGDNCAGYRVLASLEIKDDADILSVGCHPETGCGWTDPSYNYGTSTGAAVGDSVWADALTDTEKWYCIDEGGVAVCHRLSYDDLIGKYHCTTSFELDEDELCRHECDLADDPSGVICAPW